MSEIPINILKGVGGEHNHTFNIETTIKYGNSMTINPKF